MMNHDYGAVCMDCHAGDLAYPKDSQGRPAPGFFCKHWTPEYWVTKGYERGWGDASVMNWPVMEVLRLIERNDSFQQVSFLILAPYALRRPLRIKASTSASVDLSFSASY